MAGRERAGGAVIYTREDLIRSYLEARRYADWADAEALVNDTQGFTEALQKAFGIQLEQFLTKGLRDPLGTLTFIFKQGVEAFEAQQNGILEAGLLYSKLQQQGPAGEKVVSQYIAVGRARGEVTRQAIQLLLAVVEAVWPDAPATMTSDDLLRLGFDDRERVDPVDYW